jgi:hypothetical protein
MRKQVDCILIRHKENCVAQHSYTLYDNRRNFCFYYVCDQSHAKFGYWKSLLALRKPGITSLSLIFLINFLK